MDVDAIQALASAESPTSRPPIPSLPLDASAVVYEALVEQLASAHPGLRAHVWVSLRAGLRTRSVSAKFARRAGAELVLALNCTSSLARQRTLSVPVAAPLRDFLCSVLWAQAALLADVTLSHADGGSIGAYSGDSCPLLGGAVTSPSLVIASAAALSRTDLTSSKQKINATTLIDVARGLGNDGSSSGTCGVRHDKACIFAAATMFSRVEDVLSLLQAASHLLLLTKQDVASALRKIDISCSEIVCPLLAVLSGALRAACVLARASPAAARRVALLMQEPSPESELLVMPDEPLVSLILRVRSVCVSTAMTARAASATFLLEQSSSAAGFAETLISLCFFSSESMAGYRSAWTQGLLLPQAAAIAYAFRNGPAPTPGMLHRLYLPHAAGKMVHLLTALGPQLSRRPEEGIAQAANVSEQPPLEDSLPFLLVVFSSRFRELMSAGDLAAAVTSPLPHLPQPMPPLKRSRKEVTGDVGLLFDEIAIAAFDAIAAEPVFSFFSELVAAIIGCTFSVDLTGLVSADEGAFPFTSSAPAIKNELPLAMILEDARRLRVLAALLAVAEELGVYSMRSDVEPSPQTATLWALGRWILAVAQRASSALVGLRTSQSSCAQAGAAAAMAAAVAGAAVALLVLAYEVAEPLLPALFTVLAQLDLEMEVAFGRSDMAVTVSAACGGSALTAVVVKAVHLAAQLRQLPACLALLCTTARPSCTAPAAAIRCLHTVLLSRPVLAAIGAALRDLPSSQTAAVGSQLLRIVLQAVNEAEATDDEKKTEDAASATLVVACYSSEALRQLRPATHSVTSCLGLAMALGTAAMGSVATLAARAPPRSRTARLLRLGVAKLVNAATDAALVCMPYTSVRRYVPSLFDATVSAWAVAEELKPLSLLDARWPLCLFVGAAVIAPIGTEVLMPQHGTAPTDVLSMIAALVEDCSAEADTSSWFGDLSRHAAIALAGARLRLLHSICCGRSSADPLDSTNRAARALICEAQRSSNALADCFFSMLSSHAEPSQNDVDLGIVDVAAASASPRALTAFAHALWSAAVGDKNFNATRGLGAGAARQLLSEAQLYELAPLRGPLAHAAAAVILSACLRALADGAHVLPITAALPCVAALELSVTAAGVVTPALADAAAAAAAAVVASSMTRRRVARVDTDVAAVAAVTCARVFTVFSALPDAISLLTGVAGSQVLILGLAITVLAQLGCHRSAYVGTSNGGDRDGCSRVSLPLESAALCLLLRLWQNPLYLEPRVCAALVRAAELTVVSRASIESAPSLLRHLRLFSFASVCLSLSGSVPAASASTMAHFSGAPTTTFTATLLAISRADALRQVLCSRQLSAAEIDYAHSLLRMTTLGLDVATGPTIALFVHLAGSMLHLSLTAAAASPHAAAPDTLTEAVFQLSATATALHLRACRALLALLNKCSASDSPAATAAATAFVESTTNALSHVHTCAPVLSARCVAVCSLDFLCLYAGLAERSGSLDVAAAASAGEADSTLRFMPSSMPFMNSLRRALAAALAVGAGSTTPFSAGAALILIRRLLATAGACVAERVLHTVGEASAAPVAIGMSGCKTSLAALHASLSPWELPAMPTCRRESTATSAVVGDGSAAVVDAVASLFRSLLPEMLTFAVHGNAVASFVCHNGQSAEEATSDALRARALLCLREIVACPRVFTLRGDELSLILEAVAASLASRVAVAMPFASPPQSSMLRTVEELVDIDIGKNLVSANSTVPLVASAAQFGINLADRDAPESARAVNSVFSDHISTASLHATFWLLHALLKYRRESANAALPLVAAALQIAAARVPGEASALAGPISRSAPTSAAYISLARACEGLATASQLAKWPALHVLSALLCTGAERGVHASGGGDLAAVSTLPATLSHTAYVLLASCTSRDIQHVHLALGQRRNARNRLKSMHRAYEEGLRYRGS